MLMLTSLLLQLSVERLNGSVLAQQSSQPGSGGGVGAGGKEEEEARQAEKQAATKLLAEQVATLVTNLTQFNTSLSSRLQWALDDITKHHVSLRYMLCREQANLM